MKKLSLILAILLLSGLSLSAKPKENPLKTETLQQCATLTRAMLPMNVDEVTILWGIGSESDSLVYYYAIKYASTDLDGTALANALKPTLIAVVKESTDETIKTLKSIFVTFEHKYYGNDGNLICDIKITPEEYNK